MPLVIIASRRISSMAVVSLSAKLSALSITPIPFSSPSPSSLRRFSTTATPYPLYYALIRYRPVRPSPPRRRRALDQPDPSSPPDAAVVGGVGEDPLAPGTAAVVVAEKSKRKYLRKRMKRMYGSTDSDDDAGASGDELVELKPEIVEFPRLHAREEELYFHDAFAYPWEKEKHYRMVYQLEKKYFPDHCLDKAFVDPATEPVPIHPTGGGGCGGGGGGDKKRKVGTGKRNKKEDVEGKDERRLVFFDDHKGHDIHTNGVDGGNADKRDVSVKTVAELFKCLKKAPIAGGNGGASSSPSREVVGEPYLVTARTQLPPRWDGPHGSVVLVDKPKGWTSFTVCGKLRRLVKVQKVGHAGTLDPMATGLLIVCVGKATKLVDRYQGMEKGYSGVFRLGEATSTWDADSLVVQREPWEHIKDNDIKKAAATFCGEIWQVPPMFSAIKVGGEKMYDKARRGETVELSPRRISIFDFDIEHSLEDRQNLIFRVSCSKGTYIRSLCADFGKALGSCAHLADLRRDSIGEYSVNDAWNFSGTSGSITKGYM